MASNFATPASSSKYRWLAGRYWVRMKTGGDTLPVDGIHRSRCSRRRRQWRRRRRKGDTKGSPTPSIDSILSLLSGRSRPAIMNHHHHPATLTLSSVKENKHGAEHGPLCLLCPAKYSVRCSFTYPMSYPCPLERWHGSKQRAGWLACWLRKRRLIRFDLGSSL